MSPADEQKYLLEAAQIGELHAASGDELAYASLVCVLLHGLTAGVNDNPARAILMTLRHDLDTFATLAAVANNASAQDQVDLSKLGVALQTFTARLDVALELLEREERGRLVRRHRRERRRQKVTVPA